MKNEKSKSPRSDRKSIPTRRIDLEAVIQLKMKTGDQGALRMLDHFLPDQKPYLG